MVNKVFERIVIASFLVLPSASSNAEVVTLNDKVQRIQIQYGLPTIFRFESKVSTVSNAESFDIKPVNQEAPDYSVLAVMPRTTSASSTVVFMLNDGSVAKLKLQTASSKSLRVIDTFYEFKAASESGASPAWMESEEGAENGKVSLLRAMILGEPLRGYEIRKPAKGIETGLMNVEATLEKVYIGQDFNGYIYKLTNKSFEKSVKVDIRRLKIGHPNLAVMSQIDRSTLQPASTSKNVAFLTILATKGSPSSVVLPVTTAKLDRSGSK